MKAILISRTEIRTMKIAMAGLVAVAFMAGTHQASAATAPSLGANVPFGIVSSTFTNNANPTVINGSVCYTTPPVTPPTTITGGPPAACPVATGTDQGLALADLNGQACISLGGGAVALNAVNVGFGPGVFTPGCYSSGGAMTVAAGSVTLTGAGVYVFRSGGTLTTAANTSVAVAGGACQSDVFWAPNAATTLGTNSSFVGNILDGVGNAVTVGSTSTLVGRILSFGGVVTTDADTITVPGCAAFVPLPPGAGGGINGVPTLSQWGLILLSGLVLLMGFFYTRRRDGR